VIGGSSLYNEAMEGELKQYCKLVIATRINKAFECDTFITDLEKNESFCPLHISQTYSQQDITFDYTFFGNIQLLASKPELVPTRLIAETPAHAEM
jgi:dihydrofolate reductase